MNNMFKDFCFNFYDLVKYIDDNYIYKIIEYNNKFKNRNNKKTILTDELAKTGIYIINNKFQDISIKSWLNKFVRPYAHFLRTAEKCFIYNNDESNIIYSEIYENKEIIYFAIKESYKIRIIFEKTKIPNIIKDEFNSILDDDCIEFITIEIKRNFGKQMVNTFKIITDNDKFDDECDEFLLKIIMEEIYKAIILQYSDILNFIIHNYTSITKFNIDFKNHRIIRALEGIYYE